MRAILNNIRARHQPIFFSTQRHTFHQPDYSSNAVSIPADFLTSEAPDAQPMTIKRVNFVAGGLPEYAGCYAVVLENVLSSSECDTLIGLAEQSAKADATGKKWRRASVNLGTHEVMMPDYRNSVRIIWDSPKMVERIYNRCLQAEALKAHLAHLRWDDNIFDGQRPKEGYEWKLCRVNERMRFLKYTKGMFFDRHQDDAYVVPEKYGQERTFYTLQLYLSGSDDVKGGATRFHSTNAEKKIDIDVKAVKGRVLIFQHRGLEHSGQEVSRGEKVTMRSDLVYELVPEDQ